MGVYSDEERAASNFTNDLANAKPAEDLVLALVSKLQPQCWYVASEGYEPRGDMYCSHCREWLEVKYDHLYGKTGNVFVEIETLKHSEARYILFVTEVWENGKPTGKISPFVTVMDYGKLKEACRDLYRKGIKPVGGGEFKKMTGYPIKLRVLQKADWVATIHSQASKATIAELLQRKYNKVHGEQRNDDRQRPGYRKTYSR